MNNKKIRNLFEQIALRDGKSVYEVRQEIELAISSAQDNPNPDIKAFWRSVPRQGRKPTPEEVIVHIARLVDKKKNCGG